MRKQNFQFLLTLSSSIWARNVNPSSSSSLPFLTTRNFIISNYSRSPRGSGPSPNAKVREKFEFDDKSILPPEPEPGISLDAVAVDPSNSVPVYSPPNSKLLKVSIIGVPNAGKSTLINRIMSLDVCPTSKRVHTTRKNQCSVYLDNNTQVVFVDTPGLVNTKEVKKFAFPQEFIQGPSSAIENADVIAVIHDISNSYYRQKLDRKLIDTLNKFPDKPSVLVLNKVDAVKCKRKLLETIKILTNSTVNGVPIPVKSIGKRTKKPNIQKQQSIDERLNQIANKDKSVELDETEPAPLEEVKMRREDEPVGWSGFRDVFMLSALTGDGVDGLKGYFVENAKNSAWLYNEDMLTDCPPIELAMRVLQSKLLENLPAEVPFRVKPVLDFWDTNESGLLKLMYTIDCPNERLVKMIIGNGGNMINTITMQIEKALVNVLQQNVDIFIKVICSKPKSDKKD